MIGTGRKVSPVYRMKRVDVMPFRKSGVPDIAVKFGHIADDTLYIATSS